MNLTALKTWVSGETLTATDLNGEFQNIYTHTITNSDIDSTGTYVLGELVVGSGITAADGGQFHVHTASAGSVQAHADANEAVLENSAASGLSILSGSSSDGNIFFGDAADNDVGKIAYSHSANSLAFTTNGATALTLSSAQAATFAGDVSVGGALTLTGGLTLNGAVVVGDSASDTLTVNATVTSDLLFTDATYDIGKSGATRPRDGFFSRNMAVGGTLGVTGATTLSSTLGVTGALTATAGITSGSDIVSDSDSTDDLGTTSVRWANLYVDSIGDTGQALAITAGSNNVNVTAGTLALTGAQTISSTLGVTGLITASGGVSGALTGNVTGDLSGSVTGGTISGSTGSFTSTISTSGGFVTVAGNPSAGVISSNGNGQIGGLTGNGLFAYGKGSTYDLVLANANTSTALAIPTGGSSTPDVYIPNSLGIGTSSPSNPLTVAGPNTATSLGSTSSIAMLDGNADNEFVNLRFATGAGGSLAYIGAKATTTGAYPNSVGELHFGIQNATTTNTAMVIDEDGRVSINHTNPAVVFEVNAGSDGAAAFRGRSDGGNGNNGRFNLLAYSDGGGAGYGGGIKIQTRDTVNVFHDALTIDSSQRVGIGTSSPTSGYNLDIANSSSANAYIRTTASSDTASSLAIEGYRSNGSAGYLSRIEAKNRNGAVAITQIDSETESVYNSGALVFKTASTGTMAERARIDSSGNLLLGRTSASLTLLGGEIAADGIVRAVGSSTSTNLAVNAGGRVNLANNSATDGNFSCIGGYNSNGLVTSQIDFINVSHSSRTGAIAFLTHTGSNMLERARIDASGNFLVGTTSTTIDTSNFGTVIKASTKEFFHSRNADGASAVGQFFGNAGNFRIKGDGDLENTNNSYGAISDERLKSDIVDASTQLADIKSVKIRKYTLNENGETHIGVVAQELEAAGMEGLVDTDEDGYKSVKYSVLYVKAVKALQEAITKIETLETKVAALEAA